MTDGWRSAQTVHQFFVAGESTSRFLRERESAVNPDFEDSTAGSAKTYFCRGSEFEDQFPRRTGARLISSLAAIFDLDFHEIDLAIQPL
jgi:hypothetical protein